MASFSKFNAFFRKVYNKSLFASNITTCMVLLGAGDCFTQFVEHKSIGFNSTADVVKAAAAAAATTTTANPTTQMNLTNTSSAFSVDWSRSMKMFAVGSAIGPVQHIWYTYLDKKFPKKTRSVIFKKVLLDQIFCAPVLNILLIGGLHLLEGERLATLKKSIQEKFFTLYLVSNFINEIKIFLNHFFYYQSTIAFYGYQLRL